MFLTYNFTYVLQVCLTRSLTLFLRQTYEFVIYKAISEYRAGCSLCNSFFIKQFGTISFFDKNDLKLVHNFRKFVPCLAKLLHNGLICKCFDDETSWNQKYYLLMLIKILWRVVLSHSKVIFVPSLPQSKKLRT